MAVSRHRVVAGQQPVGKRSEAASLAELVNMILDKGIVINGWASVSMDAWARVSVLGLELLTIEARMVVTSVETYLRYANAIGRITPAARPGSGLYQMCALYHHHSGLHAPIVCNSCAARLAGTARGTRSGKPRRTAGPSRSSTGIQIGRGGQVV